MKSVAKKILAENQRFFLRSQWNNLRTLGPRSFVKWNAMLSSAWLRDLAARRHYRPVTEDELRAARTSETVFVFGSGASLNDLSQAEWEYFSKHDVFGFNMFYHEHWIPVGFHILRSGVYGDPNWRPYAEEAMRDITANPLFARTIFVLQGEYFAEFGNHLIGHRMMPEHARVFRYHTARADGPPTRSFREGLRHNAGTLSDAVNCAYVMGWKRIVLVGVDLYDSRYFFLPPDQTVGFDPSTGSVAGFERNTWRGQRFDQPHNTTRNGIVDVMSAWRDALAEDGVELTVYNSKSLLAAVLRVEQRPGIAAAHQ